MTDGTTRWNAGLRLAAGRRVLRAAAGRSAGYRDGGANVTGPVPVVQSR